MIDIKFIRDHAEEVQKNAERRGVDIDVAHLLSLDEERRAIMQQKEQLRAEQKKGSKGKPTPEEIQKMKALSEQIQSLEQTLAEKEEKYKKQMMRMPNMTHANVPDGGEDDARVMKEVGAPPQFDFAPRTHEEIMIDLDLVDFDRGSKVTGSKFYFLKGAAVRLNQALLNYGMDILEKHGFVLMETPDLAKQEIIEGLGFNPRGEETQIYNIENTDLSLIGTAEITVGGFHADEIIDLSDGPKKYAAISHCFRTEAGSYGRTSKGLYRVHQFTKLEMFIYCKPEESEALHAQLLEIEQEICNGLEFPYRVVDIAAGDLGAPAYRKFDIEAYMTMADGYGEITSTSNCTDFQARRLNIRHKKEDGQTEYVHTLNGTAVVLSRFPIALLENMQQEDGSIRIPKALIPYMGGKEYIST